jgi:hypothetical protein
MPATSLSISASQGKVTDKTKLFLCSENTSGIILQKPYYCKIALSAERITVR